MADLNSTNFVDRIVNFFVVNEGTLNEGSRENEAIKLGKVNVAQSLEVLKLSPLCSTAWNVYRHVQIK